MGEHAVIVEFNYDDADLTRLFELEDQLISAIDAADVGRFDGNDVSTDRSEKSRLYMYGPNADRLFEVVRPVLEATAFIHDAVVIKEYGSPEEGAQVTRFQLGHDPRA